MYHKIANSLTCFFIKKKIITEEDKDVYCYGFEILISTIVYESIFLLVAILTHTIIASIGFWVSFFIIRSCCGGYHARSYFRCHFMFLTNQLLFIFLYKYLLINVSSVFALTILPICAILILVFAPVDHPNKPFIKNEYSKFKRRSRIYCCIIPLIALPLFLFSDHLNGLDWGYSLGSLSATLSLLCAKILYKKERKTNYEEVA